MGNIGSIVRGGVPTGFEGRRDSLTDLEETLETDGFEEEIEEEKVVVADDHRQVGLELTKRQNQRPHVQIRSRGRRQSDFNVRSCT